MSDVATEPRVEDLARIYLQDRITECLLDADEPLKVSQILSGVHHDGTFTSRLLRAVMESSERFQAVDRRWALTPLEGDSRRPIEALIEQTLGHVGRPLEAARIARLLAEPLARPEEVLLPSVEQVVSSRGKYFPAGNRWGLASWLLDVDDQDEEEIVFRNFFFDEERLAHFREKMAGFRWKKEDPAGSALRFLQQAGEPVPGKVLQYFGWRATHRAFHPDALFAGLLANEDVVFLSSGDWCSLEVVGDFTRTLEEFAAQLTEEEAPEGEEAEERIQSLQISENEVNEIASVLGDLRSHRISELIEAIFELSPGERDYTAAFGNVWGAMGADERFAWVGGERWRLAGTVPRALNKVPDLLELPFLPYFVSEEGEPLDVELSEEGFEGDLLEWVKDPRVMIAGQPMPEATVPDEAPAKVAVPVRYEHRLAGTLGVFGDLRALFPTAPDLIEVNLYYGGKGYTSWVNNSTNLALELGPFFDRLDLPLCGGLFQLSPRGRGPTTDYAVAYSAGDVDPLVALSDERLATLEAMREDPENVQTSTFDLLRKIMEEYKKGVHFVTLFTEVNVVRRTHAYLIASLLSAYACFTYLRPGHWGYEEKKVDQGIRKQKRKYVKE